MNALCVQSTDSLYFRQTTLASITRHVASDKSNIGLDLDIYILFDWLLQITQDKSNKPNKDNIHFLEFIHAIHHEHT